MRCEEILHRPVERTRPDESLADAARRMRDANVGFLPVVASSGEVVGTITDRDLVVRAFARGYHPTDTEVDEIMSHSPVTCRPTDELEWAARLMALNHVARLVVTDAAGHLCGVVSLSDIAKHLENASSTLRAVASREVAERT